MRSSTFTDRWPVPTGVSVGPLRASLFFRIDSSTRGGRAEPSLPIAEAPAISVCHSNPSPVAVKTRTAAATTSGPMPSPGINVIE